MKFGVSKPERELKIRNLLSLPSKTEPFRINDLETEDLRRYEVELGFPKYRMTNIRTTIQHKLYRKTNNLPADFFSDPESDVVQSAQHEILTTMMYDKDLLDRFQGGDTQVESIVLTLDGFVISGNRRLCCWRHLYYQNPQKYSHFENIKVVIYQHLSNSPQVKKFEALQETDKTSKAPFDWINIALEFDTVIQQYDDEGELETGYEIVLSRYRNSELLVKKSDRGKKGEINEWIKAAKIAVKLLDTDKIELGDIINQKQAFKNWSENSMRLTGSHIRKQIYDKISENIVLADKKEIGDRKYNPINKVFKYFDKILKQEIMKNKISILKTDVEQESEVLDVISSRSNEKAIINVKEQLKTIQSREKWRKDAKAVVNLLSEAHTNLQEAIGAINDDTVWIGVDSQLDEIAEKTTVVRKQYNRFNNKRKK